jgi:hypothetical protein
VPHLRPLRFEAAIKVVEMFLLSCKGMRRLVTLSGLLFAVGVVLQLVHNIWMPNDPLFVSLIPYLAFILILCSPVLLLSTVVISMLPGKSRKMQSCEH